MLGIRLAAALGRGYDSDVVLGVLLAVILPFLGLYVFATLSQFYRSRQRDVVGPHVVEPVQRDYGGTPYTCYRCKYCGKEFERRTFFRDEDCDTFEADR